MPRVVDPDERSAEIIAAAIKVLSEGGFAKLTLGNLAAELGGSMRRVTHYFRNREELIDGILDHLAVETREIHAELAGISSRNDRIRHALEWFLFPDEASIREEKVRIALLAHRNDPTVQRFFDEVEPAMRSVLDSALAPEADSGRSDLLRLWTSGLALNVIERPEQWPIGRQRRALAEILTLVAG